MAMKSNKDCHWTKYKNIRNRVNNEKHTFFNYYDNKETYIDDASKNNHKLYWKRLTIEQLMIYHL